MQVVRKICATSEKLRVGRELEFVFTTEELVSNLSQSVPTLYNYRTGRGGNALYNHHTMIKLTWSLDLLGVTGGYALLT